MTASLPKNLPRIQLVGFGLGLGFKALINGNLRIALKRIILPINYWRVTIFKLVADYILNLDWIIDQGIKILDIGSPKMLSLFLSTHLYGVIYATDLQDKTIFTEWQKYYRNLASKKKMSSILFEFENAKLLNYPDKFFDVVYSLSVIHMITPSDDGDILSLKEMQKKIKPRGTLIIEVPYRMNYAVNFANRSNFEETFEGEPLFKERQYDDIALEERIGNNISGDLVKKIILYERLPFDLIWSKLPRIVTALLAFIEPWVDILNIAIAKNEKQKNKGKSAILFYQIES